MTKQERALDVMKMALSVLNRLGLGDQLRPVTRLSVMVMQDDLKYVRLSVEPLSRWKARVEIMSLSLVDKNGRPMIGGPNPDRALASQIASAVRSIDSAVVVNLDDLDAAG